MIEIPSIRIELQHMRQSILSALPMFLDEIDRETRAALDAALASFDYKAEIRKATHDVLRQAIEAALKDAAYEMRKDPEFRETVKRAFLRSLGGQ